MKENPDDPYVMKYDFESVATKKSATGYEEKTLWQSEVGGGDVDLEDPYQISDLFKDSPTKDGEADSLGKKVDDKDQSSTQDAKVEGLEKSPTPKRRPQYTKAKTLAKSKIDL